MRTEDEDCAVSMIGSHLKS